MSYVIINDNKYEIPEVTFDTICQLEENGVYLLNMDRKNPKLATMVRGLCAWIMDVEPEEASVEIQKHIENGGNIVDIITRVTREVSKSGFFKQRSHERQDQEAVTEFPQNREQRRKANRKNNTDHSRRS